MKFPWRYHWCQACFALRPAAILPTVIPRCFLPPSPSVRPEVPPPCPGRPTAGASAQLTGRFRSLRFDYSAQPDGWWRGRHGNERALPVVREGFERRRGGGDGLHSRRVCFIQFHVDDSTTEARCSFTTCVHRGD